MWPLKMSNSFFVQILAQPLFTHVNNSAAGVKCSFADNLSFQLQALSNNWSVLWPHLLSLRHLLSQSVFFTISARCYCPRLHTFIYFLFGRVYELKGQRLCQCVCRDAFVLHINERVPTARPRRRLPAFTLIFSGLAWEGGGRRLIGVSVAGRSVLLHPTAMHHPSVLQPIFSLRGDSIMQNNWKQKTAFTLCDRAHDDTPVTLYCIVFYLSTGDVPSCSTRNTLSCPAIRSTISHLTPSSSRQEFPSRRMDFNPLPRIWLVVQTGYLPLSSP